jgi:hypothetical protein
MKGCSCQLLGGSDGMDCGHESLHDAKVVVDNLGQGGLVDCSAGGIDNIEELLYSS